MNPVTLFTELRNRQKTLAIYGMILLVLAVPALIGQWLDPRTVAGENVWIKPTKFLVSIAVFAITSGWFFGYVQPARRNSKLMLGTVAVVIVAGSFELFYISWQAANGLPSHFNGTTPFYTIMYRLMGLGAFLLIATTLPLAWEIGRRPAEALKPVFVASIVIGLVLCFVLGGSFGGYMSQQSGHAVGAVGGSAPIFGWNRAGGDMRIAHFMGIHAQQIIPLVGMLAVRASSLVAWTAVLAGSTFYAVATVALFVQAINGLPLPLP